MTINRIQEFKNIYKKANKLEEGLFNSGYDYTMSKGDRQYIMQTRNTYRGNRISERFLNIIGVSQEVKDKFKDFENKYGKMPQFSYESRFGYTKGNAHVEFQKTISANGKTHNVSDFFTKEDTDEIIDKWIDTYNKAVEEHDIYKETPEAVVDNVVKFAKKNKLTVGCAIFGVAALATVIPTIVNNYKSNEDIREAVEYYMGTIDWDANDDGRTRLVPRYYGGKTHAAARHVKGNREETKDILVAVTKYAKNNGVTLNEAFHILDGKKLFGVDSYKFNILEDNDGVLTLQVWNETGKKPKTIEIDTNTYQRIGNATFTWQESIKNKRRSNSYKENSRDDYNRRQRSIDRENRNTESLGNFMDAMDNDGRFIRGFFEWSEDCYNWGCEVDTDTHIVVTTAYDTSSARVTLYDTTTGETILDEDMVPRNYDKVIAACKRMTSNGDYYDFSDLEDDE